MVRVQGCIALILFILALTACGKDVTVSPINTSLPRIDDLFLNAATETTLTVSWTAPADHHGNSAYAYDLRIRTTGTGDWNFARPAADPPMPAGPGHIELSTIDSLRFGTTYYLSIRYQDSKGTWADFSYPTRMQTSTPDAHRLVLPPDQIHEPLAWSPGADHLLFARTAISSYSVQLESLDPSTLTLNTLVSPQPGSVLQRLSVSWSPDGSRIAYASNNGSSADIYTVSSSGGVSSLVAEDAVAPAWSPDGKKLAYLSLIYPSNDYPTRVHLVIRDEHGGTEAMSDTLRLQIWGRPLSWNPMGDRLAYCDDNKLWEFNVNTKAATLLGSIGSSGDVTLQDLHYLPGGESVVLMAFLNSENGYSAWLATRGQDPRRLTEPNALRWPVLAVAPDGNSIALMGQYSLYVLNLTDGTESSLGVAGLAAAWAPDGKQLAFIRYEYSYGTQTLWTIDPS